MKFQKTFILLLTATMVVSGCGKKTDETPAPAAPPSGGGGGGQLDHMPAHGTMSLQRAYSSNTSFATGPNSAFGFFMSSSGSVDVGTVTVNDIPLEYFGTQWGGYYNLSDPQLDMNGTATWSVEGGNGFPAMSMSVSGDMPEVGFITSSNTISAGQPYTLTVASVANADFVRFSIGVLVSKIVDGNATSVTFSASELAVLELGETYIDVTAIRRNRTTQGGKTMDALKSTERTTGATIQ